MIKEIGAVSCADDEDAFAAVAHTVQLGEKLGDDAVHDTTAVSLVTSLGGDGVEFVKEDDARPGIACALEYTSDVGF